MILTYEGLTELVNQYKKESDELIRDLMRICVIGNIPYDNVINMTYNERKILIEVIKEKIESQNPDKKSYL